jgi:branched-chain amino acid transport system permease protein
VSDTQKLDRPTEPAATPTATPATSRTRTLVRVVLGLALLLVLLAFPLYVDATWLRVGEFVMVSAVAAIGLTMLTGHCGQLSLGTPFFMLVGATTYATLASDPVAESGLVALGWPPLLALLGAIVVSGLAGLAFAPVAGRVGGIYLSVATLALVYLGLYLGQRFSELTGGAATGRPSPAFEVLGFSFTTAQPEFLLLGVPLNAPERTWYLFLVFTAIAFVLATGAVRSRPGRAWRAVRDNPASATAMGVDVARTRAGAFVVSSAYAGLAGVMTIQWFGLLKADENEFDGSWSITVAIGLLAMIIIGGLGSITGAVVGAAFVSGFPLALNVLVPQVGFLQDLTTGDGGFTPVVLTAYAYGALIVLLVIFEPGGLAAIARRLTHRFTRVTTR